MASRKSKIAALPTAHPGVRSVVATLVLLQTAAINAQERPNIAQEANPLEQNRSASQTRPTASNWPDDEQFSDSSTLQNLAIEQSLKSWQFAQEQIRLRKFDSAIRVLKQLTILGGVPNDIRTAAGRSLAALERYNRNDASFVSDTIENATIELDSSANATTGSGQSANTTNQSDPSANATIGSTPSAEAPTGLSASVEKPAEPTAPAVVTPEPKPAKSTATDTDGKRYPESEFTIGAEYAHTSNEGKELEGDKKDDDTENTIELKIEHEYKFNRQFTSFIDVDFSVERETKEKEGSYFKAGEFSRGDTFIEYDFSEGKLDRTITAGTQSISSDSGWWWDDDLDLVALSMDKDNWEVKTAIGVPFVDPIFGKKIDLEDQDIWRVFGEFEWEYRKDHKAALLLLSEFDTSKGQSVGDVVSAKDNDDEDNKINWVGMRYSGEWFKKGRQPVEYWLDIATVYGEEVKYDFKGIDDANGDETVFDLTEEIETTDIAGWGLDLGAILPTRLPGEPEFKFGFATTSKDANLENKIDGTFRQTGLHDNKYGMVLEPELSNLTIMTLGVEFEPVSDVKIEIMYYDFRQVVAQKKPKDIDADVDFTGASKNIGTEIDIELEISIWDPLEFAFSFGIFKAGDARKIDDEEEGIGDTVEYGTFEIKYEF